VSARDERLAGNEALFREVNERVAEVATHFIEVETSAEQINFACECGRADCAQPITMTMVEDEAIRAIVRRLAADLSARAQGDLFRMGWQPWPPEGRLRA